VVAASLAARTAASSFRMKISASMAVLPWCALTVSGQGRAFGSLARMPSALALARAGGIRLRRRALKHGLARPRYQGIARALHVGGNRGCNARAVALIASIRSRIENTLLDKTSTSDGAPYLASKCRWRKVIE
jgi:hypothetical protein